MTNLSGSSATPSRDNSSYNTTLRMHTPPVERDATYSDGSIRRNSSVRFGRDPMAGDAHSAVVIAEVVGPISDRPPNLAESEDFRYRLRRVLIPGCLIERVVPASVSRSRQPYGMSPPAFRVAEPDLAAILAHQACAGAGKNARWRVTDPALLGTRISESCCLWLYNS